MKKFRVRLSYILAALLILGSIFITPYYTSFADEPEENAIVQETEQELFAEDASAEDAFAEEDITEEDDHSEFSDEMLQAAINRYKRPMLRNVVPGDETDTDPHKIIDGASLPYTSEGRVLALHIDFPEDPEDSPNHAHPEGDNETALEDALGFLHDYYQRASYGQLDITGDVYSYSAKMPRGDYEDRYALLSEVLTALDEQINYKDYDADDDDRIDCVVMHLPYNERDGWGSTWWPSCSVGSWQDIEQLNEASIGSNIILSRNVAEEDGPRTLVHECGHAMGFPDYYSYDKEATDSDKYPYLTGTLTFDMMDNNTGDHNGFSKWIAGWLTNDDVTYVNANENGVSAYRGGQEIGTRNEDGSITLPLSSFDSDVIDQTGGIIVVGNDLGNDLFSNFYMLQYDTFAGNERVYYRENPLTKLSSGFRVFRVQAELAYGHLIHSNTSDGLFNKLIELVDHDYQIPHSRSSYPFVTAAYEEQDPYGCMFYAGDELNPTTDPSTNFMENINAGFTGIYMEFLESEDTYGSVKIWYSEEAKPAEQEFQLELTSAEAIPGGYNISLEANQKLTLTSPYAVYGIIDQMGAFIYYIRDMVVDGHTLTGKIFCDPDLLTKESSFKIRCIEGAFYTSGEKNSPQIEIPVPISQDMVDLEESGYVKGTEIIDTDYGDIGVHKFSPIRRLEDGTYTFYEYSNTYSISEAGNTILHQYFFTEDAPGELREELIPGDSEEYLEVMEMNHAYLRRDPTENAAIVPEGVQLGEYPYVYDAVKVDDMYYVLSYRKKNGWGTADPSPEQDGVLYNAPELNELALSKLDASGNLIKQITVGNDIVQDPDSYLAPSVLIQAGPNEKLAVLLFQPAQEYYDNHLVNHAGTFFYDKDLNFEGRLDNYSTGCGTWLDDGRYIAFTQRVMPGSIDELDQRIDRTKLINYDITGVIDPPQEVEYIPEDGTDGNTVIWESGSNEGLAFTIHRTPEDSADISRMNFQGVKVDGNPITEGKEYTVEFKSVHITLLPAYLNTLSAGKHVLTIQFYDADDVKIPFEIKAAAPAPTPGPNTGDTTNYTIWIVLMSVTFAIMIAAIVLLVHKRKRIRK